MKKNKIRQSSFNPPKTFLNRLKKKHNLDQLMEDSKEDLVEEVHPHHPHHDHVHKSNINIDHLNNDKLPDHLEPKILDPIRRKLFGAKNPSKKHLLFSVPKPKSMMQMNFTIKAPSEKPKSKSSLSVMNEERGPITNMLFDLMQTKDDKRTVQYENTVMLDFYHSQMAVIAMLEFIIAMVSIALVIFLQSGLDQTIDVGYNYETDLLVSSILAGITVILWVLMVMEYWIDSKIIFIFKKIPPFFYRKAPKNLFSLIFKMIVFGIHPNPGFSAIAVPYYSNPYNSTVYYPLNSILSIFIIPRIAFSIKFVITLSGFSKPRTVRIARMKGISLDFLYYFKVLVKKNSFFVYPMLFIMFLLFGSYGIIVGETPLESLTGNDFHTWWNALWCTIITIMTIGYGDYVPRSLIGRIMVIISGIGGAFLLSMLIATFSEIFSFDKGEKQVCVLIERLMMEEVKKSQTCKIIPKYLSLLSSFKHAENPNLKEFEKIRNRLYRDNLDLQDTINSIKESFNEEDQNDYVVQQTGQMQLRLDQLKNKFDKLSERFTKLDIKNDDSDSDDKGEDNKDDADKLNLKSFACDSIIRNHSILSSSLIN